MHWPGLDPHSGERDRTRIGLGPRLADHHSGWGATATGRCERREAPIRPGTGADGVAPLTWDGDRAALPPRRPRHPPPLHRRGGPLRGAHFRQVGSSGLYLPAISLGLWWNFGDNIPGRPARPPAARLRPGITHFDLANNYGPPYGSAEKNFGRIFAEDFRPYRDELIISSKAGWDMWPGPYGDLGSRKYILASAEQSLTRMGLDYVDIFYSHRVDPVTPIEETIGALDTLVRQGKALYVGISSYSAERTEAAADVARELGTPLVIHQPSYSILNRWVEDGLTETLREEGWARSRSRRSRRACSPTSTSATAPPRAQKRGSLPDKPLSDEGLASCAPERPRPGARAEPRPAGPAVGAARRRRGLGAHRRLASGAARREPRRAGRPSSPPRRSRASTASPARVST
jgi:diketogulonate reductase-like aldo/keto reductase